MNPPSSRVGLGDFHMEKCLGVKEFSKIRVGLTLEGGVDFSRVG